MLWLHIAYSWFCLPISTEKLICLYAAKSKITSAICHDIFQMSRPKLIVLSRSRKKHDNHVFPMNKTLLSGFFPWAWKHCVLLNMFFFPFSFLSRLNRWLILSPSVHLSFSVLFHLKEWILLWMSLLYIEFMCLHNMFRLKKQSQISSSVSCCFCMWMTKNLNMYSITCVLLPCCKSIVTNNLQDYLFKVITFLIRSGNFWGSRFGTREN